jgi:hypothetical protein
LPTSAIAAYGTELRLSNGVAATALNISGTTATTPIVVTTATPHGVTVGGVTWADVAGVTGNVAANGTWVVEGLTTTTLRLRGSIGTAASGAVGTLTIRGVFATVAELVNITPIGIAFNMVDASAHDGNGWGTSIPTFKRGVDMRVEVNLVPDHATHDELTGMLFVALGKIRRDWMIVLPDAGHTTVAFQAWVSDHGTVTPFDGVLRSTPVLTIDGAMLFATP